MGVRAARDPAAEARATAAVLRWDFRIAFLINVVMAVAGVLVSWLSRSDALALDGVVSALNAATILVGQRVDTLVRRPSNSRFPLGYWGLETLYAGGRSLILLGIIVFALITHVGRLLSFAGGVRFEPPVFGLVPPYSLAMVLLCLTMAACHHRAWTRTGSSNAILKVERLSAVVDGAISAGVGLAFLVAPLLESTPLSPLVPVTDSLVVVLLCLLIIRDPLATLRRAVWELSGGAADPGTRAPLLREAAAVLAGRGIVLVDHAIFRIGRAIQAILYVHPECEVVPADLEACRAAIEQRLRSRYPVVTIVLSIAQPGPAGEPPSGVSGVG
ncbi:hypothetical protein EVJ50_10005 [Synechococcus sp. RSCCF101]|uniref:cation transporter n=1 Tax=Synechococcus sp. RSCCF101 TaxID=2511069 RepID=UPI00124547A5|nr:cation transporter [Synechococcus sp. RSCCF101]QEY32500.1 hypothetical protein EVJ50_10005 [Synechococcus sp. RSCCF101]